jgi:hypothetical protein
MTPIDSNFKLINPTLLFQRFFWSIVNLVGVDLQLMAMELVLGYL